MLKHLGLRSTILFTALGAVLLCSPASAEVGRWRGADPVGDVSAAAFDPDPPPCGTWTEPQVTVGDIARLDVRHRQGSVQLAARFAEPTPPEDLSVSFPVLADDHTYKIDVWTDRRGTHADLLRPSPINPEDFGEPDECGGFIVLTDAGVVPCRLRTSMTPRLVTVVIPRACLRGPRWVRAGIEINGFGDDLYFSDRWAPPAVDDTEWWIPDYGPRVRVAR